MDSQQTMFTTNSNPKLYMIALYQNHIFYMKGCRLLEYKTEALSRKRNCISAVQACKQASVGSIGQHRWGGNYLDKFMLI